MKGIAIFILSVLLAGILAGGVYLLTGFLGTPMGYWEDKENGMKVTKWLIEEKLKLTDEVLKEQLSVKLFKDNGLKGMLERCFDGSLYEAINNAYPSKYKVWEFKNVPRDYWTIDTGIKATKWLLEDTL